MNLQSCITLNNNQITTTSLKVAEAFGKQHKDVLKRIYNLDCSPEFASAHFCAHVQKVIIGNGASRESKVYEMTKDGFMFLVMGFTGKKAAAIKEAYINAFNAMAAKLGISDAGTVPTLTDDQCALIRGKVSDVVATMPNIETAVAYASTYRKMKAQLKVSSYRDIPQARFDQAVDYLDGLLSEAKKEAIEPPAPQATHTIALPKADPMATEYRPDFYCNDLTLEPLARLIQELSDAEERGEAVLVQNTRAARNEYTAIVTILRRYHNQIQHIKGMISQTPSVTM